MKQLRSQQEIMAHWKEDNKKPVVSICCVTYNHAKFIEDALEGFLIQETDFPFEILIHDDASTDGTSNIIREYEKAYPELIKPVYQPENTYSQGKRWFQYLLPISRGKYIAHCEGDDFWTDPRKLQIQVDFLEKNLDYVISGHDAYIIDEAGQKIKESKLPDNHKRDYSQEELKKDEAWILTLSWVYRNVLKDYAPAPERLMVKNGDKFFTSIIGQFGKSHFHHEIKPAAYRVHPGGIWSTLSPRECTESHANTYFWMYKYFERKNDQETAHLYWLKYQAHTLKLLSSRDLLREIVIRICFIRKIKTMLNQLYKTIR